jgi:hypothetical protein
VRPPTPSRRHVWVDVSGGYTCPGLVMAWRRELAGWEAQVAVVRDRTVFVQWVAATALHPVVDDAWSTGPGPAPRRGPAPSA